MTIALVIIFTLALIGIVVCLLAWRCTGKPIDISAKIAAESRERIKTFRRVM